MRSDVHCRRYCWLVDCMCFVLFNSSGCCCQFIFHYSSDCLACYLFRGSISYIVPFLLCLIVPQQFIFLSSQVSLAVTELFICDLYPCPPILLLKSPIIWYNWTLISSAGSSWVYAVLLILGLCAPRPVIWFVFYKSVCFALPIIQTAITILTDHSWTLAASLSLRIHMHIHTGVINSQSDSGNWRNIWPQQLYPKPFWHPWLAGRLSGLS